MRKILILPAFLFATLTGQSQIIADHSVVDKYDAIPQQYIDLVKNMLVDISGESHSLGYRIGMNLLESYDSKFQAITYDGSIPGLTNNSLRLGRHASVGEEEFYTSASAVNAYKSHITTQNTGGNPYSVIGFGWCWDMTWHNAPGGGTDPVHKVRWAGSSVEGPNGDVRWGLDAGDQSLTGNSVCMDTYFNAVEQYIQHCTTNGYPTKVIFTTGPVDDGNGVMAGTENGFQREIKHDYIRTYVKANNSRILFDYADILCWNNSGAEYNANWNDGGTIRPHANIHPDNMKDYDGSWNMIAHSEDGDHIGEVGALRLAKAMWWLLARIAGWNGVTTDAEKISLNEPKIWTDVNGDELIIHLPENLTSVKLELYSIDGSLKASSKYNSNILCVNISGFPKGLYIMVLHHSSGSETKKIILP